MPIEKKPRARTRGYTLVDTDNGNRFAGMIGEGADDAAAPTAAAHAEVPSVLAEVHPADPASIERQFDEHRRLLAERLNQAEDTPAPQPYEEVAFALARTLPVDLDAAQFDEAHRLLENSVRRTLGPDAAGVACNEEAWQAWLAQARERLSADELDIPDADRQRLLALLDEAEAGPVPSARDLALISGLEKKAWAAHFGLYDGYRQISAWHDASPVEVKMTVARFRQEYLDAAAAGQAPQIDEEYAKAFKRTSYSAPKDPATIYAHMRAEEPEHYDPPAVPTKFIAFDTETTGKDPATSHIVQVGIVQYDHDGNEVGRFVRYVRPPEREGEGLTGPPDAVAVHGITPEDVANAPTFAEIVPELRSYFEGSTVIGHNVIDFDMKHVSAEMVRAADGDPSAGRNVWPRAADTLWYCKRFVKSDNHKLATMAAHFGVGDFNAHDAGDDAAATAQMFFAIRKDLQARREAGAQARRAADPWYVTS